MGDYGIEINDTFLDFYPDTVLSFELNSPLYFGDDANEIQGSFMFSVNVPLSPGNRLLLQNPQLVDNARRFVKSVACGVWVEGVQLFQGTLDVVDSAERSVNVRVLINMLQPLKELQMNALNVGTFPVGRITTAELEAEMLATVQNPEAYNYVFVPVHNTAFFVTLSTFALAFDEFQNYYDLTTAAFSVQEGGAVTPFLKLNYVLSRLFAHVGYTLNNDFQTTVELQQLLVYNAYTLFSKLGATGHFDVPLNKCLSTTKANEFLKTVCSTFAVAPFANAFTQQVTLKCFKDLLTNAAKSDWTSKVVGLKQVSQSDEFPKHFKFLESDLSPVLEADKLPKFTTISTNIQMPKSGIYKIESEDSHVSAVLATVENSNTEQYTDYYPSDYKTVQTGTNTLESKVKTITTARLHSASFTSVDATTTWTYKNYFGAAIQHKGFDSGENSTTQSDIFMFYRGFKNLTAQFGPQGAIPYASNEVRTAVIGNATQPIEIGNTPAQYALHWDGEAGIYNRFWAEWHTFLSQKRHVTHVLNLSLKDLLAFEFSDKIRIDNKEYFVKTLKITLSRRGLQAVEADLITNS